MVALPLRLRPSHLFLTSALALFLHSSVFAHAARHMASSSNNPASSLEDGGVIPDVLDAFSPEIQVRVSYEDKAVSVGDQLLPIEAVHMPRVVLEGSQVRVGVWCGAGS